MVCVKGDSFKCISAGIKYISEINVFYGRGDMNAFYTRGGFESFVVDKDCTCFDNGIFNTALYSEGICTEIYNTFGLFREPAACVKTTILKIYLSLGSVIEVCEVRSIIEK